ncbi:MAG: arsenate reductase ArsC [Candidatus Thermoplasmatota archaeon]
MKRNVLFLCTHNSCRSQMAEGLLKKFYGNRFKVFSAGIKSTSVHRLAVIVMDEIGVDISGHRSKSIYEFKDKTFDYVVTVCDNSREKCPFFPGEHMLHKDFEDPGVFEGSYEEKIGRFRIVRDEIREWIGNLVYKEILI